MGVDDCVTLAEVLGERLADADWLGELVPSWLGDWVADGEAAALRDCVCDCEGVSVVVGACDWVPDAA